MSRWSYLYLGKRPHPRIHKMCSQPDMFRKRSHQRKSPKVRLQRLENCLYQQNGISTHVCWSLSDPQSIWHEEGYCWVATTNIAAKTRYCNHKTNKQTTMWQSLRKPPYTWTCASCLETRQVFRGNFGVYSKTQVRPYASRTVLVTFAVTVALKTATDLDRSQQRAKTNNLYLSYHGEIRKRYDAW